MTKSNNMYSFSLPIEVSFLVDESNITIRSIKDLKKIMKNYDVDLDFIIDEYEYKVDLEESFIEDTDSPCLNNYEIFNIILKDHWETIKKSFNSKSTLSDLDDNVIKKIFNIVKKNFANYNIYKFIDKSLPIKTITLSGYDKVNSQLIVDIETFEIINDDTIEQIRYFLDNQCADGWGVEIENIDISRELKDKRIVYVNIWSEIEEVKYIS